MTFTHEQILDAVRKAGRDGKTFSSAAVREHLNLSTRDRRVLSRFHRQFRAFQDVAVDEIVKVGNNSYRLKSALVESAQHGVAAASLEPLGALKTETEAAELAAEAGFAEEAISAAPVAEAAALAGEADVPAAEEAAFEPAAASEPVVVAAQPVAEAAEPVAVAAEPILEVAVSAATGNEIADRQLELVIAEIAAPAAVDLEPAALGGATSTAEALSASDVSSTACDVEAVFTSEADLAPVEAVGEREVADTADIAELALVSEAALLVAVEPGELAVQAGPSEQAGASAVEEPSSFFDEAPARFEPTLDSELELHELAASMPLEAQPDARRSMLSLSEAAQLFDTPAPRQPAESRVRSWVSSPLEHAQSLLSGSWRERGQRLGRRVAGLFNRA